MATKENLEKGFKDLHDTLTDLYYRQQMIPQEEFLKLHMACWLLLEQELIGQGLVEDDVFYDENGVKTGRRSEEIVFILPDTKEADWKKQGLETPDEVIAAAEIA